MTLEGSVCGFIRAPRRWHFRAQRDTTGTGWRQHQLDPCLYMKFNKSRQRIAICGVYAGDFIMGFSPCSEGQSCKEELMGILGYSFLQTVRSTVLAELRLFHSVDSEGVYRCYQVCTGAQTHEARTKAVGFFRRQDSSRHQRRNSMVGDEHKT